MNHGDRKGGPSIRRQFLQRDDRLFASADQQVLEPVENTFIAAMVAVGSSLKGCIRGGADKSPEQKFRSPVEERFRVPLHSHEKGVFPIFQGLDDTVG